jgi:hypothetical protein
VCSGRDEACSWSGEAEHRRSLSALMALNTSRIECFRLYGVPSSTIVPLLPTKVYYLKPSPVPNLLLLWYFGRFAPALSSNLPNNSHCTVTTHRHPHHRDGMRGKSPQTTTQNDQEASNIPPTERGSPDWTNIVYVPRLRPYQMGDFLDPWSGGAEPWASDPPLTEPNPARDNHD